MSQFKLKMSATIRLAFVLEKNGIRVAELETYPEDDHLFVDLIALPNKNRHQLSEQLLCCLVDYAREHYLKVIPLNKYIRQRLRNHTYRDVLE